MKPVKCLFFLLLPIICFISCQKELTGDEVLNDGNATGTLKASGTGDCLPSSVQGNYTAGTALNTTNYINVTVDFTGIGLYTISSDTVNGYSFYTTGIASATGLQTITLNATGTPVAMGANTFTVKFGSSQCSIVVNVVAAVPGPGNGIAVFTLDCSTMSSGGTFTQGVATNPSNRIQVNAIVTTAGTYSIATTTNNNISFSASGYLDLGTQLITLNANGAVPPDAGTVDYTLTAGTNTCPISILYNPGTPPSAFTWTLRLNGTTYSGNCDEGTYNPTQPGGLFVTGTNAGGDQFSISMGNLNGAFTTGAYPGTFAPGKMTANFKFIHAGNTYSFISLTAVGNIDSEITDINTTTQVITGNFSGTAVNQAAGNTTVNISPGSFKVHYP